MEYTTEYDSVNHICLVTVAGEYIRSRDSKKLKDLAIKLHAENSCRNFLFDMTRSRIASTTMETYAAGNPSEEQAEILRLLKAAVVHNEITEQERFFETVVFNRGYRLRMFKDIEKATQWLKTKGELH